MWCGVGYWCGKGMKKGMGRDGGGGSGDDDSYSEDKGAKHSVFCGGDDKAMAWWWC